VTTGEWNASESARPASGPAARGRDPARPSAVLGAPAAGGGPGSAAPAPSLRAATVSACPGPAPSGRGPSTAIAGAPAGRAGPGAPAEGPRVSWAFTGVTAGTSCLRRISPRSIVGLTVNVGARPVAWMFFWATMV